MEARQIALITDSTCDIPAHLLEEYSIIVQPHVIIWDGQQYRDRVDLQPDAFYRRLSNDPIQPTTSQATVQDFSEVFRRAHERGAKEVVAILVNSGFSGAIQSAQQAAREAPLPVHIHDSRGATMGLGWQVLAAARARQAGGGVADMLAAAERVRRGVHLYIGLDTLEYLYRGGRIGNARRLAGAMLNIKPLIFVDHDRGVVETAGKAMTRRKSLDLLYRTFFARLDPKRPLHLAVLHGDAAEDAQTLQERIHQEYHPVELLTNITCPALGIHTGPRAVALCGYAE